MRKLFLILAVVAAIAVPGSALAAGGSPGPTPGPTPQPSTLCGGQSCSGGGLGSTGCWSEEFWSNRGLPYAASISHYLLITFCKSLGTITSVSINVHGCDTTGLAFCHVGPAFISSGGVGQGFVTVEGHADFGTTISKLLGYNGTDIVYATVNPG